MTAMEFPFERNFDEEIAKEAGARILVPADALREVETARAEGFEAGRHVGHKEGRAEAEAEYREATGAAMGVLAAEASALLAQASAHRVALEAQMLDFAMNVCRQLFPQALETRGEERAAEEIRRHLLLAMGSTRLTITLSDAGVAEHGAALEAALPRDLPGTRVEILADAGLAPGEARMRWDNGAMEFSFDRICRRILDALAGARPVGAEDQRSETDG